MSTEEESCKHNFINNVCINCEEETEGTINYEKTFGTKSTNKAVSPSLKEDLKNLNLDDNIFSSVFRMYRQGAENNIYRSKLRKSILYVCICMAYKERGIAYDKKSLL